MKQKLVNDIGNIKKKEHFVSIFKIIKKNNPDIVINENKNGIFLFFNNLNEKTYIDIDKYLSKLNNIDETTETIDEGILFNSSETEQIDGGFKYSNKEKSLIKKKNYDTIISTQNNESLSYTKKKLKK